MNCAVHTDTPAVAYCRTCGKALCENCKRDVMGAIYCEPCIAVRLQGAQTATPPPPLPPGTPVATVPGAPSPGIAMLLGFIPGVGAMYNGQFMKGFIHVVIFVMLIIGTEYHWAFGLMIGFFVIYMAFDAYKTAEARKLGLPLPDALGLDRLFGLQEGHSVPTAATPAGTTIPGQPAQPARSSNEPTGAIVLIVLGVFFLLTTLGPFSMHRLWPLFLIGTGLWIAYKRTTVRG